ncbi:DEAD/H associated domain protein [Parafrankia sp. EUN1f]|nr:DEAD/H associated domain protein [Parafrankia sp. EUN1f]
MNAPWALAIGARLRERYGSEVQIMHTDDGVVARVPDAAEAPRAELVIFDPAEIEAIVRAEVGGSALFASRFRECASRSLLLPRRTPGRRTPLWQQRQRSAHLLSVAATFGDFPVVLETMRECLQDVYDVPALVGLMREVDARSLRVVEVETTAPSPFASSLLFGYVAAFMYDGDAPLAERRAQVLSLDSSLLAELLGETELRELIDPRVLERIVAELQRLVPERHARDAESAADLLRVLGDLSLEEAAARGVEHSWLESLERAGRAIRVRITGAERWVPVEDAGRLRDALGVALPVGVPAAFTELVRDPLGDLISRYARTHGPFESADVAGRFGLGVAVVEGVLERLTVEGRLVRGELHPDRAGEQWCDAGVLRSLRRRSLAALRKEVEAVPVRAMGEFLPAWQSVTTQRGRGVDGVLRAIEQLQGALVPASSLEQLVLPSRVSDYAPAMLDELCATGEVLWAGSGGLPGNDGWLTLVLAETAEDLLPQPDPDAAAGPTHRAILDALADGQALFFRGLSDRVGSLDDTGLVEDTALANALWDLVWAGLVTNDTLAALRVQLGAGHPAQASRRAPRGRVARLGRGRPAMPRRTGPPTVGGRWSLLPERESDPTRRAHALAEALLERHGIVTRGAVAAEHTPGGFAAVYRVLAAFEEAGRCRRGYFVESLGAAQFAVPGAVDRLRAIAAAQRDAADQPSWATSGQPNRAAAGPISMGAGLAGAGVAGGGMAGGGMAGGGMAGAGAGHVASARLAGGAGFGMPRPGQADARAVVLAAADPANPYGAALPWPPRPAAAGEGEGSGHRAGRKAGAVVVIVDGELVLYVERGGRTLLSWSDTAALLGPAVEALAQAVRAGALGRLTVEKADGVAVVGSGLGVALEAAGFHPTPRGLRLRA